MTAPELSAASSAQASQAGLVIVMQADLDAAFASLQTQDLKKSVPSFTAIVAALVRKYGSGSATLAARFYKQQRSAAGISSLFTVKPAALPTLPRIGQSVDWATQPLWSETPDLVTARSNVQGVAENLVLGVGRNTVIENVHRDPKAKGWARITEPSPCYFCALLATRGAVYKSERGADFKSHNHCRCHAEPDFGDYHLSDQVKQWQQQYYAATRGVSGAKNLQLAWRHAFTAKP